jgi:hypothetical protein
MRCTVEHGGEAEELARRRFIDGHVLVIVVDSGHQHGTGDQHVAATARVANLVDPLARREPLQLHLRRQDSCFVVVEQRKQGDLFQNLRIARHRHLATLPIMLRDAPTLLPYVPHLPFPPFLPDPPYQGIVRLENLRPISAAS